MDTDLSAGAGIAAYTIVTLVLKALVLARVLKPDDCAAILDDGLLQLERHQMTVPPQDRRAWSAARLIIAETLPPSLRHATV